MGGNFLFSDAFFTKLDETGSIKWIEMNILLK